MCLYYPVRHDSLVTTLAQHWHPRVKRLLDDVCHMARMLQVLDAVRMGADKFLLSLEADAVALGAEVSGSTALLARLETLAVKTNLAEVPWEFPR